MIVLHLFLSIVCAEQNSYTLLYHSLVQGWPTYGVGATGDMGSLAWDRFGERTVAVADRAGSRASGQARSTKQDKKQKAE